MICVEGLSFRAGAFELREISLQIPSQEYFVLLGPTGSGKTLLLECLCGLNRISGGQVSIDGADITHLEPRDRSVAYLPQDYALFPHLSVSDNIIFGLQQRGWERQRALQRCGELLELLAIGGLAQRFPRQLSGGEKQRVALARALAIEPRALLLDEPVSALDEVTREEVCRELKSFQRRTGTTAVHVCHNFAEMLNLADRVGIIDGGRILQVGTPREILDKPQSLSIARFVQSGNIIPAQASLENGQSLCQCPGGVTLCSTARLHGKVHAIIRPERLRLKTSDGPRGDELSLSGTVVQLSDTGACLKIQVRLNAEFELQLITTRSEAERLGVKPQQSLEMLYRPADVQVVNS